jgi:replication factor C subunit 2/4
MDFFSKIIIEPKAIDINMPWVEKYRPKNADEILLDPFIKQKITQMLENKSIPNIIFSGSPGTGKTSTILFLAKELYKDKYQDNVLELNASDDRGLSIINNTIYPFCKKKINNDSEYPNHKLIILDEADSITSKAQNSLSNIISEFINTTRIVFICNNCSQIIESIQSRCIIIKYPRIDIDNLYNKIEYICKNENIKYDSNGINTLLFVSDQDIRQSINNLECIYYSFNELNEDIVYKLIDKPKKYYIIEILKYCYDSDYIATINVVKNLYNKGYTPNDILLTFMKYLFDQNEKSLSYPEEIKLNIYEILIQNYIRINESIDTLLQLCGCISKIYLYIQEIKKSLIL